MTEFAETEQKEEIYELSRCISDIYPLEGEGDFALIRQVLEIRDRLIAIRDALAASASVNREI